MDKESLSEHLNIIANRHMNFSRQKKSYNNKNKFTLFSEIVNKYTEEEKQKINEILHKGCFGFLEDGTIEEEKMVYEIFSKLYTPIPLQFLIRTLEKDYSLSKRYAIWNLSEFYNIDSNSLIELAKTGSDDIKMLSIEYLKKFGDVEALNFLKNIVKDERESWKIRLKAIKSIGWTGIDKETLEWFLTILKKHNFNLEMVLSIIKVLGYAECMIAVPVLLEYLKNDNDSVVEVAIKSLVYIGDKSIIPGLLNLMEEKPQFKELVCRSLFYFDDEKSNLILSNLIDDSNEDIREIAVYVLCKGKNCRKTDTILSNMLLNDKSIKIREIIRVHLENKRFHKIKSINHDIMKRQILSEHISKEIYIIKVSTSVIFLNEKGFLHKKKEPLSYRVFKLLCRLHKEDLNKKYKKEEDYGKRFRFFTIGQITDKLRLVCCDNDIICALKRIKINIILNIQNKDFQIIIEKKPYSGFRINPYYCEVKFDS